MWQRIISLLVKEFLELRRDKWSRFRLTVPTMVQVIIFGYAATFEVLGVSTAVLDLDHSQESRELLWRFTFSNRFHIATIANTQSDIKAAIDGREAAVAVVIHSGFAESLRKGQSASLQVIVDGTNSNTARIALGYVDQISQKFARDYEIGLVQNLRGQQNGRSFQVVIEPQPLV